MTALSAARPTKEMLGQMLSVPVKASTVCYAGGLAVANGGYAAPGTTATGLIALGRFEFNANNAAGADGAINATIKPGIFAFANSAAGDAIAQADVGASCYIVDDQTVAKTSGTNTRSVAGKVVAVDADGVWVKVGI